MFARKRKRSGRLAVKLVTAVLAALLWFGQAAYAAGMFVQNGSGGQGGYQTGGYETDSPQPAAYNWARESTSALPEKFDLNYMIKFPDLKPNEGVTHFAFGSDGTVYFTAGGKLIVIPQGKPAYLMVVEGDDPLLSSPVVGADGTLYIGSRGKVLAIDTAELLATKSLESALKWTFAADSSTELFFQPIALGGDGTVYAAGDVGSLYAINPANGMQKWKFSSDHAFPLLTPVIAENGYLFVVEDLATQAKLYIVDANGNKAGSRLLGKPANVPAISAGGAQGILWVPQGDGSLFSVDIEQFIADPEVTGAVYANAEGEALSSPLIGPDGTIYVSSAERLFAFDPSSWDPSDDTPLKEIYKLGNKPPYPIPPIMDNQGALLLVGEYYVFKYSLSDADIWKVAGSDWPGVLCSAPAVDANGNLYLLADVWDEAYLYVIGEDKTGPFLSHGGLNSHHDGFLHETVYVVDELLYLVFDDEINPDSLPEPEDFAVMDHGEPVPVQDVHFLIWSNSVIVLVLDRPVINGQQVTVQINAQVKDTLGNPSEPFPVLTAFDATSPDLVEAVFSGSTIKLTFDEDVTFIFESDSIDEYLTIIVTDQDGEAKDADIVDIKADGTDVLIELASPLKDSDRVLVSYNPTPDFWTAPDEPNLIRDESKLVISGWVFGGNVAKNFERYATYEPPSSGGTKPGGGSGSGGSSGGQPGGQPAGQPGEQPGDDKDRRVEILIPVPVLQEWRAQYPSGVIYVETPQVVYILPLSDMDPDAIEWTPDAKQPLNENEELYVKLTISVVEGETLEALLAAADEADLDKIGDAIEFKLQIVKDDKDIIWIPFGELIPDITNREDLKFFKGYIRRSIFLSGEADPGHTVAVYYDPVNGKLYPVPTKLLDADDGKIEVRFQRPGLSIYAIVTQDRSFADIAGHWAEKEIHRLANKWLARGRTEDRYFPNEAITRAEFTALLVRALGLQGLGDHLQLPYTDVRETAWYYRDLKAAVRYGLVREESAAFRPDDPILRRDMMIMLSRAYKAIGEWRPVDADRVLSRYEDSIRVPADLRPIIAGLVDRGVIIGITPTLLAPDAYATRAEAAAVIRRFLSSVDYM